MRRRWCAAGLLRAEAKFRRVKGHREMPALLKAFEDAIAQEKRLELSERSRDNTLEEPPSFQLRWVGISRIVINDPATVGSRVRRRLAGRCDPIPTRVRCGAASHRLCGEAVMPRRRSRRAEAP